MTNTNFTAETPRYRVQELISKTMKHCMFSKNPLRLCVSAIILLFISASAYAQIAVKGETVWTMAGEPITNGVVLVNNGKIEAVGTAAQVTIPANYRVINAKVV